MSNPNKFDQRGTFIRFSIPGAKLPGQETPVPDLLVKSYWESFSVKMQQKITRTKTKGGWVEEHWPGDLDTISVNGATGAFILVGDPNTRHLENKVHEGRRTLDLKVNEKSTPEAPLAEPLRKGPDYGLATGDQVFLRRLSEAALNLEALADFYRSNGASFSVGGKISGIRDIDLHYMGDLYRGYFMNFNYTHSEKSPNQFTYTFTFRVRETFLTETSPISETPDS